MSNDIEGIKKKMDSGEGFFIEFDERCDKCRRQYLGLELHIKLPEVVVLCEFCVPKDRNEMDWMVPIYIGELD